jgi:hypothetical protein
LNCAWGDAKRNEPVVITEDGANCSSEPPVHSPPRSITPVLPAVGASSSPTESARPTLPP